MGTPRVHTMRRCYTCGMRTTVGLLAVVLSMVGGCAPDACDRLCAASDGCGIDYGPNDCRTLCLDAVSRNNPSQQELADCPVCYEAAACDVDAVTACITSDGTATDGVCGFLER